MKRSSVFALFFAGTLSLAASSSASDTQEDPGSVIGGFFEELVGYLERDDQIEEGDMAPDFELPALRSYDFGAGVTTADGNVRLSAFRGSRPVALVFGSYT